MRMKWWGMARCNVISIWFIVDKCYACVYQSNDFVNSLENWENSVEAKASFFKGKCRLLVILFTLIGPGKNPGGARI